jgi:hypothetical protein
MVVLKRCAEERAKAYDVYRPAASIVIFPPTDKEQNEWIVAESEEMQISAEGPTLETAICLFAKSQTERKEG